MSSLNHIAKCKIKMNGTTGHYSSVGEYELFDEGFEIRYKLFEDNCVLNYSRSTLSHRREGQVNLDMSFIEGQQTTCFLGDGENKGSFVVFSDLVQVKILNNGAKVKLSYISDGEKVELNFVAIRQE